MFKAIRISLLLLVLVTVASTVLIQRDVAADWQGLIDIRIIPVVADDKPQTLKYVNKLSVRQFKDIEPFLVSQANKYNVDLDNGLSIKLENSISDVPPEVPGHESSKLEIIIWSLKLKWWAWQHRLDDHRIRQIRLYVLYQSPDKNVALPHSTGLQNGLLGLVNARATKQQSSLHQVIITHELMHIFGAHDKYNINNGMPSHPFGFANPNKKPLFPQSKAELMGRSIPLTQDKIEVATRLRQVVIGKTTAQEIGWLSE